MIFFGRDFRFLSRGWIALPPCGHTAEPLKQLAVVLRQSSRVRSGCHDVPHRRFCQKHRSLFPLCGCSAGETCALPSRQAGKAYTGSAKYGVRQIHDRNAFSSFSFNMSNLGHDPSVRPQGVGRFRSAKLIRARFKGICQNYPNRCPAQPESCPNLDESTTRAEVRRDRKKPAFMS